MDKKEALRLAEQHPAAFDILLNDYMDAEKAALLIVTWVRSGKNVAEIKAAAEHFVNLRKSFRGQTNG